MSGQDTLKTAAARLRGLEAPRAKLDACTKPEILLDENLSFDSACSLVADRFMHGPAAQSTIDAIVYALRRGTSALAEADTRERLRCVDEKQLREMCVQLQRRKLSGPGFSPP